VKIMKLETLRPVLAPLTGAIMCLTFMPRPDAAVPAATGATAAQFIARALNPDDAKDAGPVEIVIRRWSTDADAEALHKTLAANVADPSVAAFQRPLPEAGVVLVRGPQTLGRRVRERRPLTVQFAREIDTPTGRQIVIATDQHLGLGEPQPSSRLGVGFDQLAAHGKAVDSEKAMSEANAAAVQAQREFMLLDIRIGRDGKGVGKVASASDVVYNTDKKMFEIKNYNAAPVRLSDVRPIDKP
jgi:hypothetical protein